MHHRKAEALQRTEAKKLEAKLTAEKAKEDAKWVDPHKETESKLNRAKAQEEKEADATRRAQEKKEILEAEERELAGYGKKKGLGPSTKIKRADIRISALSSINTAKPVKVVTTVHNEPLIPLNNRIDADLIARGGEVIAARGLDEALLALKVTQDETDMHPEKRQKAAYNAFEAKRLPQLKEEFPTLKFTQLKEKLHREWKKSPENPMADK